MNCPFSILVLYIGDIIIIIIIIIIQFIGFNQFCIYQIYT